MPPLRGWRAALVTSAEHTPDLSKRSHGGVTGFVAPVEVAQQGGAPRARGGAPRSHAEPAEHAPLHLVGVVSGVVAFVALGATLYVGNVIHRW